MRVFTMQCNSGKEFNMNKQGSFTLAGLIAAASLIAGCATTTDLGVIPVKDIYGGRA